MDFRHYIYNHNSECIWAKKNTPEENLKLLAEEVSRLDRELYNFQHEYNQRLYNSFSARIKRLLNWKQAWNNYKISSGIAKRIGLKNK